MTLTRQLNQVPDRNVMDRLFVLIQYVLPHHALTRLVGAVVSWSWLQPFLIRWFIRRYGVDLSEAVIDSAAGYYTFNAFFTRALKPGARPLAGDDNTVVMPADGCLSALGDISAGRLLQAKGMSYELQALLGGRADLAECFNNGAYATVYLAPRDYHRVHMPLDGRLLQTVYVPGRLFSVNPVTTAQVAGLFARNERLVCLFETAVGRVAVILVGAMIVAGIETVWGGKVRPGRADRLPRSEQFGKQRNVTLRRGDELGRFEFGSTVIVLFTPDSVMLTDSLGLQSHVQMGQALAHLVPGQRFPTNQDDMI